MGVKRILIPTDHAHPPNAHPHRKSNEGQNVIFMRLLAAPLSDTPDALPASAPAHPRYAAACSPSDAALPPIKPTAAPANAPAQRGLYSQASRGPFPSNAAHTAAGRPDSRAVPPILPI